VAPPLAAAVAAAAFLGAAFLRLRGTPASPVGPPSRHVEGGVVVHLRRTLWFRKPEHHGGQVKGRRMCMMHAPQGKSCEEEGGGGGRRPPSSLWSSPTARIPELRMATVTGVQEVCVCV